ncbi:hypothetical protein MKX03_010747 [Papaver bracteatum]|nr:hypothetical protein MKX03_010747 [Papaver bracteatum]
MIQLVRWLHDFFVHGCRVSQISPFRSYIQILMKLSDVALPSQAANAVYKVISKWADDLKSGLLSPEDVLYLKEFLLKLESNILPTIPDKWELKKKFEHSDNISFLCFGELSVDEKGMLSEKISELVHSIGVPSLSEVMTREAIFYGVEDNKDKASLVDWVLPFAQHYICKMHPDKYFLLKQAGADNMSHLQECSCLIQGNILYVTQDSDTHSIFLELSRLFYNGIRELHLANFLHMITTMAESGSTEEQTELFILLVRRSQNFLTVNPFGVFHHHPLCKKSKRKLEYNTSWPPADWKTVPDFNNSHTNGLKTRTGYVPLPIESSQKEDKPEGVVSFLQDHGIPFGYSVDWNSQAVASLTVGLQEESASKEGQPRSGTGRCAYTEGVLNRSVTRSATNAQRTGKRGEMAAFDYFTNLVGEESVNWVNKEVETGLPYDIVLSKNGESKETGSQFHQAVEKGDSFSVVHVVLSDSEVETISYFRNPPQQCRQGFMQLAVLFTKDPKTKNVVYQKTRDNKGDRK